MRKPTSTIASAVIPAVAVPALAIALTLGLPALALVAQQLPPQHPPLQHPPVPRSPGGSQQPDHEPSPFDGQWVADVPMPGGGKPVRFTMLLMTEGDELRGTLQIGTARAVPIEEGKVRGDVISFQRTLGDKEGVVRFLARVLDDGLHVGFMQRPPAGTTAPPDGSSRVINFVAKRASARVHP